MLGGTSARRKVGTHANTLAAGAAVAAVLLAAFAGAPASQAAEPLAIAIAEFDYVDTSGEMQDQTKKHEALMAAFMEALRAGVGQSAKFRVVSLRCDGQPCTVRGTNSSDVIQQARNAGATLLLFGGIHKQSTLIQWGKAEVVDLQRDKLVYDRLLTFRGDDANAWLRAEEFLARDLENADLSK